MVLEPRYNTQNLQSSGVQIAPQANIQPVQGVRQIAVNNLNRSIQTVSQGNATNAAIANQIGDDIIGMYGAVASTEAYQKAQRKQTNTVADIFGAAAQGLSVYAELQKQKLERKQKEAEELRLQTLAELEDDKQQLLVNSTDVIRNQGGYTQYKRDVQNFINRYENVLKPEDIVSLTAQLYEPARTVMGREAEETYEGIQQITSQQRENQVSEAVLNFSADFARLENAVTPDQADTAIASITQRMQTAFQNLPPLEQSIAVQRVLTTLQSSYDTSNRNFAKVQSELENYNNFLVEYEDTLAQYNQTGDRVQFEAQMAAHRIAYGIDFGELGDPLLAQRDYNSRIDLQQQARNAQNQGLIDAGKALQLDQDQIVSLAYLFYNQPELISQYAVNPLLSESGYFESAIQLSEAMRSLETNQVEVARQNTALAAQMQRLNVENAEEVVSFFSGNRQSLDMLQSLGIMSQFDRGLQQALEQLVLPQEDQTAEERAKAVETVMQQRAEIIDILQQQQEANLMSLQQYERQLSYYGINSPEDFQRIAESAPARIDELNRTLAEERNRVMQDLGSLPNFSLPQLETVSYGETEVVTPFNVGVPVSLSSSIGMRTHPITGQQRYHAGIDLSVPQNTDVVFYTQGIVTQVRSDPNGYGSYVDIKSPDGKLHRFAHMSHIGITEGQTVTPGMIIGRSGGGQGTPGAGSSTGPHLHWEIRDADAASIYGETGTMNPLEYVSQFRGQATLPRTADGDIPENMPEGAMPLGGGSWLQNDTVVTPEGRVASLSDLLPGASGLPHTGPQSSSPSSSLPSLNSFASVERADYGANEAGHNYGYSALARDNSFRTRLHQVASSLNIPTQWLADVMAYETAGQFAANVENYGGSGARGLIQFMPATARGLGTTTEALSRMSNTEQLTYVEKYLKEFSNQNQLLSPYHVLMAVWGGAPGMRLLMQDPERVRNYSDGDITFKEYTQRLGSHAGRRYFPLYDPPPTHTRPTQGCATCQGLQRSNSSFVRHAGQ